MDAQPPSIIQRPCGMSAMEPRRPGIGAVVMTSSPDELGGVDLRLSVLRQRSIADVLNTTTNAAVMVGHYGCNECGP